MSGRSHRLTTALFCLSQTSVRASGKNISCPKKSHDRLALAHTLPQPPNEPLSNLHPAERRLLRKKEYALSKGKVVRKDYIDRAQKGGQASVSVGTHRAPSRRSGRPSYRRIPSGSSTGSFRTDPYLLSQHISKQCSSTESSADRMLRTTKLDECIDLVKGLPVEVANVVVWNALVREANQMGKRKLAYDLWMDMKRRHLIPTTRSYVTYFSSLASKISPKRPIETSLSQDRPRTVFNQWLKYASAVQSGEIREEAMGGEEGKDQINNFPTNSYLTLMARMGYMEELLRVFDEMVSSSLTPDSEYGLALRPDVRTYSIVLGALARRGEPSDIDKAREIWKHLSSIVASPSPSSPQWAEQGPLLPTLAINIFRKSSRTEDIEMVVEIAKEWFGFVDRGREHSLSTRRSSDVDVGSASTPSSSSISSANQLSSPKSALDEAALSSILSALLDLRKYSLAVAWFNQVLEFPDRFGIREEAGVRVGQENRPVVTRTHYDLVTAALGKLGRPDRAEAFLSRLFATATERSLLPPHLRPTVSTYTNALNAAWNADDFTRAVRFWEWMTQKPVPPSGTSSHVQDEGDPAFEPNTKRSGLPPLRPDDKAMATFVQVGLSSRDWRKIERTVKVAEAEGFLPFESGPVGGDGRRSEADGAVGTDGRRMKDVKVDAFWRRKLAVALETALDRLGLSIKNRKEGRSGPDSDENTGQDGVVSRSYFTLQVLQRWRSDLLRFLGPEYVRDPRVHKGGKGGPVIV